MSKSTVDAFSACTAISEPLAFALMPSFATQLCHQCLKKPTEKLLRCTACRFVYYCSKACQSAAWSEHKLECALVRDRLAYVAAYGDAQAPLNLLVLRLFLKHRNGDLSKLKSKYTGRNFNWLLTDASKHELSNEPNLFANAKKFFVELAKPDDAANELFVNLYKTVRHNMQQVQRFIGEDLLSKPANSFVGQAIYLDFAGVQHSCRPNVQRAFRGRKMCLIPLIGRDGTPSIDARVVSLTTLSAIDESATKGGRRGILTIEHCECERCEDPEDCKLCAIFCAECGAIVPVDDTDIRRSNGARFKELSLSTAVKMKEILPTFAQVMKSVEPSGEGPDFDYFNLAPMCQIVCTSCKQTQSFEHVEYAFALMSFITIRQAPEFKLDVGGDEQIRSNRSFLLRLEAATARVLPECNLYRAMLRGTVASELESTLDGDERAAHLLACYETMRTCYPRGHFVLFMEYALRAAIALVECGKFDEAKPIVDEAQLAASIFFECARDVERVDEVEPLMEILRGLRAEVGRGGK